MRYKVRYIKQIERYIMFNYIEGFEVLGEDIFVYKNFVLQEELKTINDLIPSLNEEEWIHDESIFGMLWNKVSAPHKELEFMRERIIALLPEGLYLGNSTSFIRLFVDNCWAPHADAHDFYDIRRKAVQLKENEPFTWADNEKWGLVVYFNEFEGGEIYYPHQNIEYKPNPGDLVIHSAEEHCFHGVRPVLSEIKYSHSNHLFEKIKIPV